MEISLLLSMFFVVARGSLLEQQQEKLNVLGRSMLKTATDIQAVQNTVLEGLSVELVPEFVDVNTQIVRIHREAGEFIEEYNMTDPYCIEVVGYMLWARKEEAVEEVQRCAEEVVGGIEKVWLVDVLEQAREKSTEAMMVVLRELTRNGDVGVVEEAVNKEVERMKMEWLEVIGVVQTSLARLSLFRQAVVKRTKDCTAEAIKQYEFHMGFLRYYMNKDEHCRR